MWIDTNNKTSPRQAPTEDREMFLNPLQADRKTRPPTRPVQHREAAHPPPPATRSSQDHGPTRRPANENRLLSATALSNTRLFMCLPDFRLAGPS